MCSVDRCDSWRRSAQSFRLPEDPEKRLEWVQFVLEVNGQRLTESSWTDIAVCEEHFAHDCFEYRATNGDDGEWLQLKPGAVPSLSVQLDSEGLETFPQSVESVGTTETAHQRDDTATGTVTSECGQKEPNVKSFNLIKKKIPPFQIKGKYFVNESCLLQLFRQKCPSCGCKLYMEKVVYGPLIVMNQHCLRCEYTYQWKSQVNARVPAAEEITPVTQKLMPTDDNPSSAASSESVSLSDEEKDPSDEGDEDEQGDEDGVSSDGEWNPAGEGLLPEKLTKDSEVETEDDGKEEGGKHHGGLKLKELCTECGSFVNILKPHTCEHKMKPYSCSICGKRCVNEMSLRRHNMIHSETYEHPCKYCHVSFKTRVDKLKHEQIHKNRKRPYQCPDCPESFVSRKERCVHLSKHHGVKEIKCEVCGFKFKNLHRLQRHSLVHTGLKPHQCSVCQRGFNQAGHLKSHMRVHTGEKPFKCQHCDRCFTHNVSLKSHVQRYHTSSSGRQPKEGESNERASDAGTDSESVNVERGPDTGGDVQKETAEMPKISKIPTGRPRGRQKSTMAGNKVKGSKGKPSKSKKTVSSAEESEGDPIDSDSSSDSEEEEKQTTQRSTGRSRKRPKSDSDSDFHPGNEKEKKKTSSCKSQGRPGKSVDV